MMTMVDGGSPHTINLVLIYSRRQLLRGLLGAVGTVGATTQLLSSCSSGATTSSGIPDVSLPDGVQLVQRFPGLLSPGNVRMPISLANQQGLLTVDNGPLPDVLSARLVNSDTSKVISESLSATKHQNGLTIPYWPFRAVITEPGIYTLFVSGGPDDGVAIQVLDARDVPVPMIGTPLPGFDTPTIDNHRGVDPVCTRTPEPCSFHTMTLNDALATSKSVAYFVGTPAFCETGSCAPGLDGLITASKQFVESIICIHAEIYTDKTAKQIAPAVDAIHMTYEPALFITDKQGTVLERLDGVFDADEIAERFNALKL